MLENSEIKVSIEKMLIGYDNNGLVFDKGDCVIRRITPIYMKKIEDIYSFYKKNCRNDFGFVETILNTSAQELIHKKYLITYPYEWTANMFKDALLFHLDLFLRLDDYGYILKDAIPTNILFNGTKPVFVDFLSIINQENLKDEKWLFDIDTKRIDPRINIIEKMLVPYFIIPFLTFADHKYEEARFMLKERTCNNIEGIDLHWNDILPPKNLLQKMKEKIFGRKDCNRCGAIKRLIESEKDFKVLCEKLLKCIEEIPVTPENSGYLSYYNSKGEDFSLSDRKAWLPKQKIVCEAIEKFKPKTVLDLGANTGWFSLMAAQMGAHVVAVEIDESCVDNLYLHSKERKLNITPLQLAFEDLEKSYFGARYDDEAYKNRDFGNNPLFEAPVNRLKCDMTLCLALVHHLVLGIGISVAEVMRILAQITMKVLVLEVVTLDDELIVAEKKSKDSSFFRNIEDFSENNYSIDVFIKEGRNYFQNFSVYSSHPDSRKIIVFEK